MRALLALALIAASGCSATCRLSVGPTIDTLGHVGGEVRLTASVGAGPVTVNAQGGGGILHASDGIHGLGQVGGGIEANFASDELYFLSIGADVVHRFLDDSKGELDDFGLGAHLALLRILDWKYVSMGRHVPFIDGHSGWGLGAELSAIGYFTNPDRGAVLFLGPSIAAFHLAN